MSLRIIIDIRHLRNFGIGTYIRNLVVALSQVDRENRYLLATHTPEVGELKQLGPNFELLLYEKPKRATFDQISYGWFLRSHGADLIHMPVNDLPILMPKPYVVTIHDMGSFLFADKTGLREDMRLRRFRRGLMRAERVIAVSEATKRDIQSFLGIPEQRIRLVYSAPDPRFFDTGSQDEKSIQAVLERFQIDYPFILYAGRIRPHKNLPKLIEAFSVVRTQLETHPEFKDLRLIIIGDEISKHPEVRRAVVQTRSQQTVRFLGFVPFETLKIFYSAAAVFAFPSLYEGFGLPPLEAMATGIPVVTSSVSSLPEVVGEAAMIVNPENVFDIARGLREALTDRGLRMQLVNAGRVQARRFDWRRTARDSLEVYREAAAARG
jgi:glycosyltransferase involved in cell wall biosynthesis